MSLLSLSACSLPPINPDLEGGKLQFVAPTRPDPAKPDAAATASSSMLSQLSFQDLLSQLDPKKYGQCDWGKQVDDASRLSCAFDGFYSPRYFIDLIGTFEGVDEKTMSALDADLKVNNVGFTYATKQIERMNQIAEKLTKAQQDSAVAPDPAASQPNKKNGKASAGSSKPPTSNPYSRFFPSDDVVRSFKPKSATDEERYPTAKAFVTEIESLSANITAVNKNSTFIEFQRRRRNRVQNSFLMSSDAACDNYKRNLNLVFSTTNFNFGVAATAAGGLGAATSSVGASRVLAALAGTISGVRAEYNDSFFRNKVVELLTKAMDTARARKKAEIRRRQTQLTSDYNVEEALGDAVQYNSFCTLIAGLQEASDSLQTASDPGLKWMANAFGGIGTDDKNMTTKLFKALGDTVDVVQKIQKSSEDPNAPTEPPTQSGGNGQETPTSPPKGDGNGNPAVAKPTAASASAPAGSAKKAKPAEKKGG